MVARLRAGSLVGTGATVLNNARIGRNCIIGAGSLLAEHKMIPDNGVVVGVPSKVVRQIDAAAAAHDVQRVRHYRQELKPAMEMPA